MRMRTIIKHYCTMRRLVDEIRVSTLLYAAIYTRGGSGGIGEASRCRAATGCPGGGAYIRGIMLAYGLQIFLTEVSDVVMSAGG